MDELLKLTGRGCCASDDAFEIGGAAPGPVDDSGGRPHADPAKPEGSWFFLTPLLSAMRLRLLSLGALLVSPLFAGEPISFNAHIRPILSDNCFACHGTDAAHRKGDRRLDTAEGAMAEIKGIRAVVPGKVEESELWQRIISPHEDETMPPLESHKKPLTAEQRELIKKWLEQGAVYQNHWAYEPVARPALPVPAAGAGDHPVDRFIGAKLASAQLSLSPETPLDVLLRRVTLDLTGLPPSVGELDAFLADTAPGAYGRVVDRLLASPRYGEHFARYWLDAVRYADTHGLHLDNVRTIWPYRDWVVNAFNRNLPFDEFTVEQIAGDQLPNSRIDQRVASGYNRNHLSTSEGGAIEPELEARNTADRADTTAAIWLGLTANCASCHDHKFDPLTQREYYSLGAIFKGLADRTWDGNIRLPGPIAVVAPDPVTQARIDALTEAIKPIEAALTARVDAELAAVPLPTYEKKPISYEVVWAEDSDVPTIASVIPGAKRPEGDWREGADVPVAGGQRALRVEGAGEHAFAFTAGDIPLVAGTEANAFVSVRPDPARPPRAISLQFTSEKKTRRLIWGDPAAFGPEVATTSIHAGELPTPGAYTRLRLNACDSGVEEGDAYTGLRIAQSDGAAWWDRAGAELSSVSAIDDPLLDSRAWARSLQRSARFVEDYPLRHDIKFLIGLSSTQTNDEEKERLKQYHRENIYAPLRATVEREHHAVRLLLSQQIHYELTLPGTLVSRELAVAKPAHLLIRGQYDKPGELVEPGTPAFLPPAKKAGERLSRLEFAQWLVDPKNPLPARVTVNRFWQQIFGAGLVRTPGDFGAQGLPPTHPELLDWLASEFVGTGWDIKGLARLLVTSRTYRQDARVSTESLERDPANLLLARASRPRLDAEVLRDQSLAVGGLLAPKIGGAPVQPYQPINIWEPVAFGGSNTKEYAQDRGDALYRRSLYTFWKRTAPAPSMTTFDAPSRENFCVGRGRSNTPLQALALMNDVQHFEAARAFAERLLSTPGSDNDRLTLAIRSVISRAPTAEESAVLAKSLATHRAHFAKDTEAATLVISNGESKPKTVQPVAEFAAWTLVANLVLNLDEAVSRN